MDQVLTTSGQLLQAWCVRVLFSYMLWLVSLCIFSLNLKTSRGKQRRKYFYLGFSKCILEMILNAQYIKEKISILDLEKVFLLKHTVKRMKIQAPDWTKYLQMIYLIKNLYLSNFCIELLKGNKNNQSNLKMDKRFEQILHQRRYTDSK